MKLEWMKLGRVFVPRAEKPWMQSHAAMPTPLHLTGSVYRIFCASRDAEQRSHVIFVDIDINRPSEVLRVSEEPVLAPGGLGCFDDHGVYPSSIVHCGQSLYLYYVGWNPGKTPPLFYSSIGLAISRNGGETFERHSTAPLVARSEHDPCLVTSPWVLRGEDAWHMWYTSGFLWEVTDSSIRSYYHVKYARSDDGITWRRDGQIAVDLAPGERNIGRPAVVQDNGGYRMWYSYVPSQGRYRIGFAASINGRTWTRRDENAGISVSETGWDSEALCYPAVFQNGGQSFMLYNGNDFGATGFGIAVGRPAA